MPTTTTTTTTTTPSAELAKLEKARDKAHAPVAELKRKRDAWNAETESLRYALSHRTRTHPEEFEGPNKVPKDGTEAARLRDKIRKRMRAVDPHQTALDAATAIFHARDVEVQQFQRENVRQRIEELRPLARAAVEQIVSGAETMKAGGDNYRSVINEVRDVVVGTPGLNGQHYGYDPRIDEWFRVAKEIPESDILLPGLTPAGEAKADAHV